MAAAGGGAAPKGAAGGGSGSNGVSVGAGSLTVSLSTIIAAIWAGIWGFDWAASHLSGTELLESILFALILGTGMTIYLVERTFWAIGKELAMAGKAPASGGGGPTITVKAVRRPGDDTSDAPK